MTTSQVSDRTEARVHGGAAALAGAISKLLGTRDWRLELWDGRTVAPEGAERFWVTFHSEEALDRLLGAFPSRAFGRAYAEDLIDVYPLRPFLEAVSGVTLREEALALPLLIGAALMLGARPSAVFLREGEARLRGRRHSRSRDAAAIRHHYDVPVQFYQLWLDSTLTYSCAYFKDAEDDIDTGEAAKLELVCKKLRIQPGESLLDIGCGWGSLPIHAARFHNARVVGLTLSPAQAEVARQHVREHGLEDRVEIRLADYRDPLDTTFDTVATIGMLEHVGRKNIPRLARSIVVPCDQAGEHSCTESPRGPATRFSAARSSTPSFFRMENWRMWGTSAPRSNAWAWRYGTSKASVSTTH